VKLYDHDSPALNKPLSNIPVAFPCLFVRRISIPRRICSLTHIFPGSSEDSNILTAGKDGDNDASLNQKTFNTQRNGQNEVDDDDYYLRGAVTQNAQKLF
jgi:hypothetical protein